MNHLSGEGIDRGHRVGVRQRNVEQLLVRAKQNGGWMGTGRVSDLWLKSGIHRVTLPVAKSSSATLESIP